MQTQLSATSAYDKSSKFQQKYYATSWIPHFKELSEEQKLEKVKKALLKYVMEAVREKR